MSTLPKLRKAAELRGGVVDLAIQPCLGGRKTVIHVEAPDGTVWSDGYVSSILVEYGHGWGHGAKEQAISEAIDRIECGLVQEAANNA